MTREEILTNKYDLSGADLRGADLRGADLSGAILSGAILSGTVLRGADLYGADLSKAILYGADLSGANLRMADLYGAILSEAIGIVCAGYDQRGYRFVGVAQKDEDYRILAGCRWFTPQEATAHWTAKSNLDALARCAVIAVNLKQGSR